MPKFALKENEFAQGSIKIFNLTIDDVDQFEAFQEGLEEKERSTFLSITTVITIISENGKPPPRGWRRKIHGVKKATEIRRNHLRLYYLAIEEHDLVICVGGNKNTQDADIRRLKSLRKQILNQIKEEGDLEIK